MKKLRVFSGIQPSGELHVGNYLGALKQWLPLQKTHECFFSIVDLHAITVPYHQVELQGRIFSAALDYLAAGLDPKKATIFVQSHVPEHTELAWLLNTITPIAELERMTQYKEKSDRSGTLVGLLDYPVLMAADILLYKTNIVPVGEDQKQHVELTRVIARKFNLRFGEVFLEPQVQLTEAKRIMSLADPSKKMSKSLGPKHYIALIDSPDVIRDKVSKAVTETGGNAAGEMSPGVASLFMLLDEFAPKESPRFRKAFTAKTIRYADMKQVLGDAIVKTLKPFQAKRADLAKRPKAVWAILNDGAKRARPIAKATLKEAKERMGLA
jgi:tryptophanyl-tRNA synthetase